MNGEFTYRVVSSRHPGQRTPPPPPPRQVRLWLLDLAHGVARCMCASAILWVAGEVLLWARGGVL